MSCLTGRSNTKKMCLYGLFTLAFGACSFVIDFEKCRQNTDCEDINQVCSDGYCIVSAETDTLAISTMPSADCQSVYGLAENQINDEDIYLLGAILPYSGSLSSHGPKIGDGIKLAVDEINQAGGILGKKIGVIICDSGTSTEKAISAANQLAATKRVPAIIGPAASSIVIDVFNEVARDANMLVMSPAATSPMITTIDDNDLLWRTCPSDALQGAAIARYLLTDERFERIAIINRDDAYGNGLRDAIMDTLCQTFPCTDSNRFFSKSYSESQATDAQSSIGAELIEFDPGVTVLISFFDDGEGFLTFASQNDVDRFVLTDALKTPKLMTDLSLSSSLMCQLVGTQPASPVGANYVSFSLRYKAKYGDVGAYAANAYDAVYLIAYAIASTDSDYITGVTLAKGLNRLSSGETVNAGASSLSEACQLLRYNPKATINYEGASGPLNFNSYGEAPSDIEGWALDLPNNAFRSLGVIFTSEGKYTDYFEDVSGIGPGCDRLHN